MNLKFKKLREDAIAPSYATEGDAGLDLRALDPVVIPVGKRATIPTGIAVELPPHTVGKICSRSGLASKKGVFVLNAPGIIDSGYRGDLGVVLQNNGDEEFVVEAGDRIAQFVIQEFITVKMVEVEELGASERGHGGFGSTGISSEVVAAAAAVVVAEEAAEELAAAEEDVVVAAEAVVFEAEADVEAEQIADEEGDVVVALPDFVADDVDSDDVDEFGVAEDETVEDEFSSNR